MLMVIRCDHCGKDGMFDVHLEFEHEQRRCGTCHHMRQDKWEYWFCNLTCMFAWLKENNVEQEGVPCKACIDHKTGKPSGWAWGFESNGKCQTCDGTMRVKQHREVTV